MSFREIMELKEEILKNNRELELRLKNQIEHYSTQFSNNISNFQKKINTMNENNTKVMNSIPEINFNISKINQLEKFDLRLDNRLSSHDLRITTILTEIEKIKTKYDKIVLDNLYVPGHVGGRCQFANLSEYLTFNINEVSLLKVETEQLIKDTKNMRNKHDNTIKQIVNLIDGSVKRCNEYTDNKQKDFQLILDTRMKEFNEKIMEIRMNVCKIQMKTEEEYNNLNIEFNKILEEKKEFTNFFQNKLISINDELSLLQKNYKTNTTNINDLKQKNKNIEKDVKNIKDNIFELIKLIKFYQKNQTKNISKSINNNKNEINMSSDEETKMIKTKRNRAGLIQDFENSNNRLININKSIGLRNNNNIQRSRRNSLSKNVNIANSSNLNSPIRRSIKKRNTMFYTGPILKLQNNPNIKNNINNNNNNIKEESKVASPTFYGLINPILNKMVENTTKEEPKDNKNNNNNKTISNSNSNSEFSINQSGRNTSNSKDKNKKKDKDKNKDKDKDKNNENNNIIIYSNINSKMDESGEDSDSDSITSNKTERNKESSKNENVFLFSKRKKKSNSKQYFSKLSLKPNIKNEIKKTKTIQNKSKILKVRFKEAIFGTDKSKYKVPNGKNILKNIINNNVKSVSNENNNNKQKKGSIGSIDSVKSKYNNKDITDILEKKVYINVKNNNKKENTNTNIKSSINITYKNKNEINIKEDNKNNYNEDSKDNNNNYKVNSNLKNDKIQNKIIDKSLNNIALIKNKNDNLLKNTSTKLLSRNNNNNQNNNNFLSPIIQNSKLNYLTTQKINNPNFTNNYSNTINIYSSISKNNKIISVLTPEKEKIHKKINSNIMQKNKNILIQKNLEVDSDTGIGYNIVSFDIPENSSLPPKTIQYYPLFGKKIHKKPPIKTEIISPLDEIYRQQYNKKIKLESLSNPNLTNELPKKISPVFGRTAYAFYSKKEIEEFGGNLTNSINIKGNITPINMKYFSKGKKKFINEMEDI